MSEQFHDETISDDDETETSIIEEKLEALKIENMASQITIQELNRRVVFLEEQLKIKNKMLEKSEKVIMPKNKERVFTTDNPQHKLDKKQSVSTFNCNDCAKIFDYIRNCTCNRNCAIR